MVYLAEIASSVFSSLFCMHPVLESTTRRAGCRDLGRTTCRAPHFTVTGIWFRAGPLTRSAVASQYSHHSRGKALWAWRDSNWNGHLTSQSRRLPTPTTTPFLYLSSTTRQTHRWATWTCTSPRTAGSCKSPMPSATTTREYPSPPNASRAEASLDDSGSGGAAGVAQRAAS